MLSVRKTRAEPGGDETIQSVTEMAKAPEELTQEFELSFDYTRSTGPVVGHFLTELRERRIVGVRGSDGRVFAPPPEYHPETAEALQEFVPLGEKGVVQTWCWVREPMSNHLLQKPFAWAMILLEGADVPMLHMVDAGEESRMKTGMEVRVRWAEQTQGHISDIACFEPCV